ncbi:MULTISPECIES: acyl-CoA dehydrogenase [unclassified Rhodococcus (in: high G+C Gram-positive bacteria)]|uniref:acyl-CoA dehydrogenase n=1 Tax=unclassified Rhodococcus (in: high G+C Gram-positive bacteria) TaxID=192944 RepID=UPI0016397544|nr:MULTISPECIES: acyl-CoA dehydrogenase [unclassified Rhodococcus (in: high G+C Gram-positive bacteria)]MBC2637667.1 acyl-CoA dehydrogenase [Rhodococcus sp. 3A]MBC2897589.1 acyl-CoA dehydrogenase [Rhodococcus sp. 4CII]
MGHYKSNLRDVEFNLFELLERDRVLGTGPFEDVDVDTARVALREVDRLAREDLAQSFEDSDRSPTIFDPVAHTVTVPPAYAATYKTWMDAEWWRLRVHPDLGGTLAPSSLNWALAEFVLGANPTLWTYVGFPTATRVVWQHGTERDRMIARIAVDRQWGATMMLTEPDAGSDVGAGRTRAIPNDDGTWNIEGVKRFITAGEHDLADNIVHLVLARPVGVEGAGGPGTKGLSLFLVPKFHFDLDTGELTGERNGVYVTNVEKKMGVKVSATCEMTLGENTPARGWLLGEVHDGIGQMFDVIEDARMMVGSKAIATLSSGYLNALDYARLRVQGADLTRSSGKAAPRVTITRHPDVRRSLLTQKSFAEGMRSLVLYAASWQDEIAIRSAAGDDTVLAEAVNDLLLPVVKGYGSERSWTVLGTECLQTFGGSGYLQDYPLEQYVRDAKIDTVYEGTTAIQAQDLFFRKIAKGNGIAFTHLVREISSFVDDPTAATDLAIERALLREAAGCVEAIVATMRADLVQANPAVEGGEVASIYKVGLNATRLLYALGDVIVAWLLGRSAAIALRALDTDVSAAERAFYEGKVAAARFFARNVLPLVAAESRIAFAVDDSVMRLDENAF